MTPHAAEAINALETVMTSLLSGTSTEGVLVTPRQIRSTGLGGFIGIHPDPEGEVSGTRVDASVVVTVEATSVASLNSALNDVRDAVLAVPRSDLVEDGILKASLEQIGERADATGNRLRQDVAFNILFEFLKVPDAAEGVIEEVPLNLRIFDPEALVDTDFGPGSLTEFEVIDDPRAVNDGPSEWLYNTEEQRIEQLSEISGGPDTATSNKPGTYLMLRTAADRPAVRDFELETTFRSDDADGGIGLVFRFRDVDNFYFLLMDPGTGYRMLARKVDNSFGQLSVAALDTSASFSVGVDHDLRLEADGSTFRAFLDDVLILEGGDTSLPAPGRVGLMSRRNSGASFFRLKLIDR